MADIHFQPAVALLVAEAFEKIRINPGNFADGRKTFEEINYDDPAQFRAEQEHIREVGSLGLCRVGIGPHSDSVPGLLAVGWCSQVEAARQLTQLTPKA